VWGFAYAKVYPGAPRRDSEPITGAVAWTVPRHAGAWMGWHDKRVSQAKLPSIFRTFAGIAPELRTNEFAYFTDTELPDLVNVDMGHRRDFGWIDHHVYNDGPWGG
jgi:hypothetical protein